MISGSKEGFLVSGINLFLKGHFCWPVKSIYPCSPKEAVFIVVKEYIRCLPSIDASPLSICC